MTLNDILFHQDKTKILSVSNTRARLSQSAKPGQACSPEQTVAIFYMKNTTKEVLLSKGNILLSKQQQLVVNRFSSEKPNLATSVKIQNGLNPPSVKSKSLYVFL